MAPMDRSFLNRKGAGDGTCGSADQERGRGLSRGLPPANIAISNEKVVAILKPGFEIDAARVIDAAGKHVLPGLVDPEGHPGHSFPLDIDLETESPAAAAAGVTTWGIQDPSPRMGKKPFVQDTRPEDVVSFHDVMDIAIKTGEETASRISTSRRSSKPTSRPKRWGNTPRSTA